MRVKYESSFLSDVQRIDNIINIDSCSINGGEKNLKPEVVYNNESGILHVFMKSGVSRCSSLEFYYGDSKAFTLSESSGEVILNPDRTLFELKFPESVRPIATIGCGNLDSDTKYLESPGYELGYSLYKDIEISSNSLVWKDSIGKYMTEKGQTEDKDYSVEVMDSLDGQLKTRSFKFKSYQNLIIEQASWTVDTITTSRIEREDVFSDISSESFLYWDSPMFDSKVDDEAPECFVNFDIYLNPGEVVFGNNDYLQYIKYSNSKQQEFKGLRIYGSSGSIVEAVFNQAYKNGPYTSYVVTIGDKGYEDIEINGLEFYHLNGIIASGPCKVSKIETIINRDNVVNTVSPNPDKTYVARVENEDGEICIHGSAEYIEYENYLGEIREIGRGIDSLDSIPKIQIERVGGTSTGWIIDSFCKKIIYKRTTSPEFVYVYSTYLVKIKDNLVVKNNEIIISSELNADYKVMVKQEGITWKNIIIPDYVNHDGRYIYVLGYKSGSKKTLRFISNIDIIDSSKIQITNSDTSGIISISSPYNVGESVLYEDDYWKGFDIDLITTSENGLNTWRPSTGGADPEPYPITVSYDGILLNYITFYAIQKMKIEPELEIWEETFPNQYTPITDSSLTIYNSIVKNFIVVKRVETISPTDNQIWYYRDLTYLNKFFITDINSIETISGSIYYLTREEESRIDGILKLNEDAKNMYVRIINVIRSDYIDNIGVLTITESAARPKSWKSLINQNTINVGITRLLTNIYIKVGNSEYDAKNGDFELVVNQIGVYNIYLATNFKFIINAGGYLRLINSLDQLYTTEKVMTNYKKSRTVNLALIKLDELIDSSTSVVEIISGTVKRKITVKYSSDLIITNSYYNSNPYYSPRVKIVNRGTSVLPNEFFYYTSSTTPNISFNELIGTITKINPMFESLKYKRHETELSITIPNRRVVSNQKYPIKSFGNIEENSLSYSSLENNPLTYYYYMKGLEHRLWYSETLFDFSDIEEQDNKIAVVLDSASGDGKTAYIVSRYSSDNRTFRSEYPTIDVSTEREDLVFTFDIQDWNRLSTPDPLTKIEYYLPIKVSSNYTNAGGNIYLGSLKFKAITKITESSIPDIIEIDDDLIDEEGINANYIKSNIIGDSTSELELQIFQAGNDPNKFAMYSGLDKWFDVDGKTQYIIPEIGSNIVVSNISISKTGSNYEATSDIIDSDLGKFITVRVDVRKRVEYNTWYSNDSSGIVAVANDISNSITIVMTYSNKVTEEVSSIQFPYSFNQAGYNKGLIVNGYCGVGHDEEPDLIEYTNVMIIDIDKSGGAVELHAGIADITGGITGSEFLAKPFKYYFLGEEPLNYLWEDGNINDKGNLLITFRSRGKDEEKNHDYVMVVEEPSELRPLKMYVIFRQSSIQPNYSLNFDPDKIGVYSDGSIAQGVDESGRIHFTSNINSELFKEVTFSLGNTGVVNPDNLSFILEEERSFKEGKGYVKVRFRPNGSNSYVKTYLYAYLNGAVIGFVPVEIGFQCLSARFCLDNEPQETYTYLSRMNPTLVSTYNGEEGTTWMAPCRAQNDNGSSVDSKSGKKYVFHRGVFQLGLVRYEFGESGPTTIDLKESSKNVEVELMYMSDKSIFESTGVDYVSKSSTDKDATGDVNYNIYNPYIEFTYRVKDEFVNTSSNITACAKITVPNDYTMIPATYYLSTLFIKSAGNELTDTVDFSLDGKDGGSGENVELEFDYHASVIKSIPYSPLTLYNNISVQHDDGSGWIKGSDGKVSNEWMEIDSKSVPGLVLFKPTSSAITERFSEVRLDLVDERTSSDIVLNSSIIKLKQTAMPISLSTYNVSLYHKNVDTLVEVYPLDGLRSESISVSAAATPFCDWITVQTGSGSDAQVNVFIRANSDIEPDTNGIVMDRSTYVIVSINYSTSHGGKYFGTAEQLIYVTQHAPNITQFTTKEDASIPVKVTNEDPIGVRISNGDYATKSDISEAASDIISSMPSCRYTPPEENK